MPPLFSITSLVSSLVCSSYLCLQLDVVPRKVDVVALGVVAVVDVEVAVGHLHQWLQQPSNNNRTTVFATVSVVTAAPSASLWLVTPRTPRA
jgi:hypothetical protein